MGDKYLSDTFPGDYLLYLAARASHLLSSEFHLELKSKNIDYKTWRILGAISDCERTVGEIADIALLNQSTLSKALDRLQTNGFLVRRNNVKSRRHVSVSLTPKGQALIETIKPLARAHEEKALGHFSKEDQSTLKKLLSEIITETA